VTAARRSPELLPARLRQPVPWKNGGGVTREVAASPAGASLSDFEWRVSTAEVTSAGPFSLFPGVDRILSILEGELSLAIDARPPVRLAAGGAPLAFAGDVPVHSTPLSATVTDLNVMARRGRFAAAVSRADVAGTSTFTLRADTTLLFALAELGVEVAGASLRLAPWDAVCFAGPGRCRVSAAAVPAALYLIEISAVPQAVLSY
jgi:environmental stress-induced protein Ves